MDNNVKNVFDDIIGAYLNDDVTKKKMSDLCRVRAVLVAIRASHAEWTLEDGKRILSSRYLSTGDSYVVFDDPAFSKWMSASREALMHSGLDPEKVNMPGWLSLSHGIQLIVGWQEDYTDNGSQILAMCETMDE